jgi:hypothetical protein
MTSTSPVRPGFLAAKASLVHLTELNQASFWDVTQAIFNEVTAHSAILYVCKFACTLISGDAQERIM